MTDLHALLKQSIIDRGISAPRDREAIYSEARRAVVRRLWEEDPPLDQDEIDARINTYDDAVSLIEADLLEHFGETRELQPAEAMEEAVGDAPYRAGDTEQERTVPMRASYADEPPPQSYSENDAYQPDETGGDAFRREPAEEDYFEGDDPGDLSEGGTSHPDPNWPPVEEYDAPLGYDPEAEEEIHDEDNGAEGDYEAPPQSDRWSAPSEDNTVRPREPAPSELPEGKRKVSDGAAVRLLAGMIIALVVVLVGIAAFVFLREPADEGITIAIEERRQVSDAATATRIAADVLPIRQTFVLFDGLDPTIFEASTDNPARFDNDSDGSFARVASSSGAAGAMIVIGPGLASSLAGQRIRVRLLARSSSDRGALSMRFAYQSGVAISHWQTANLDPEYNEVGILWRVPAQTTSTSGDRLIIEPGIPGDGSGADIKAVEIDILAPQ